MNDLRKYIARIECSMGRIFRQEEKNRKVINFGIFRMMHHRNEIVKDIERAKARETITTIIKRTVLQAVHSIEIHRSPRRVITPSFFYGQKSIYRNDLCVRVLKVAVFQACYVQAQSYCIVHTHTHSAKVMKKNMN